MTSGKRGGCNLPERGAELHEMSVPVQDAATIILVRDPQDAPRILMGQRGRAAAFMPEKFVFPGGAVDEADEAVPCPRLDPACRKRLLAETTATDPDRFAAAAIRELWEETGQCLGRTGNWPNPPVPWRDFAERGLLPDASRLSFFFRALTPPGHSRRYDARFFLADAAALRFDADDFSRAESELSHIQWVPVDRARELDLPFITQLVLTELQHHLPRTDAPDHVPYLCNDEAGSRVIWL